MGSQVTFLENLWCCTLQRTCGDVVIEKERSEKKPRPHGYSTRRALDTLFHCCNKSMVLLEPGNHTIDTVNCNTPKVGCENEKVKTTSLFKKGVTFRQLAHHTSKLDCFGKNRVGRKRNPTGGQ